MCMTKLLQYPKIAHREFGLSIGELMLWGNIIVMIAMTKLRNKIQDFETLADLSIDIAELSAVTKF
jgi:hypothetical protein